MRLSSTFKCRVRDEIGCNKGAHRRRNEWGRKCAKDIIVTTQHLCLYIDLPCLCIPPYPLFLPSREELLISECFEVERVWSFPSSPPTDSHSSNPHLGRSIDLLFHTCMLQSHFSAALSSDLPVPTLDHGYIYCVLHNPLQDP